MEYQLARITWEHKGILSSEHIELDNWSMNNFVNEYLNSFEWWEFGFFHLNDIKEDIEENKGDEDYTPIIPLSEFEKYNTQTLVYNNGELFPEETSWRNFDSLNREDSNDVLYIMNQAYRTILFENILSN